MLLGALGLTQFAAMIRPQHHAGTAPITDLRYVLQVKR